MKPAVRSSTKELAVRSIPFRDRNTERALRVGKWMIVEPEKLKVLDCVSALTD